MAWLWTAVWCSQPAPCMHSSAIRPKSLPTLHCGSLPSQAALEDEGGCFKGKRCVVTGSGNVAQYCVMKVRRLGAL